MPEIGIENIRMRRKQSKLHLGGTEMKRSVAFFLGFMILISCLLSGCGNHPKDTAVKEPVSPEEENALSVYVVKNDALYQKAVNAFKRETEGVVLNITPFDSYRTMLDVMNEELMDGDGPDVVLYNSRQGKVDAQKLAQSGLFLPLDSYIKDLDPEIYPAVLMDAGHIAGRQYFIPFSYNLTYAFTSEKLMEERGYSASDSIYETILSEADALTNADRISSNMRILRDDPVNAFFDAAGIKLFDKNSGNVTVDQKELEEICRFVKTIAYDGWKKAEALNLTRSNDFKDALKEYSFLTEDYSFMNNIRYYQSMYPENGDSQMVAMPYHRLNDPEELCASIVCFGGVNANTKMPDKAYELLKYILDFDVMTGFSKYEESSVYYAPVSLTAYQKAIDELTDSTGVGPVTIQQLSKENAEQLTEITQRITDANIPNVTLGINLQKILEPYFQGEDSFENCCKAFLNKLQLYLSE